MNELFGEISSIVSRDSNQFRFISLKTKDRLSQIYGKYLCLKPVCANAIQFVHISSSKTSNFGSLILPKTFAFTVCDIFGHVLIQALKSAFPH